MKNLLHEIHDYQPIEPIDLARGQLDFAAIASTTPSIRQVLFKAQTMGPMVSKPSPWKMTVAAACTVAGLGLVAWPWIPSRSSLNVLQVGFEQAIPREEAQRLVNKLLRSEDENVVLGAQFVSDSSRSDEANGAELGRLRLSLLGVGMQTQKLQDDYSKRILAASERQLDPLFQISVRENHTDWMSPLQLAVYEIRQRRSTAGSASRSKLPDAGLAKSVLASAPLLKKALGEEIAGLNRGFELEELRFLAPEENALESGLDFSVAAWPLPAGVKINLYGSLTVGEQTELRELVEAFLVHAGLGASPAALASGPQPWLPVTVRLLTPTGAYDRRLSEQLQAWLVQPQAAELASLQFEPQTRVEEAMSRFLPQQGYTLEAAPLRRSTRSSDRQYFYEFTVRLTGKVESLSEARAKIEKIPGEEPSDSQDW